MQPILTVTELNKQTKQWLEQGFSSIQVKGEVSNIARPASKHLYFTLKDDAAQIKCAYFRHLQNGWSQSLENGQSVVLVGKVTLYEARGDYQIIVSDIIPDGEGVLLQQIEHLKQKLQNEGLFEPSSKRCIPKQPKKIGVITSDSGAAIHDILTTLNKRYPIANVTLYCCEVQGLSAPSTIIRALHTASLDEDIDVLIIARGGGSLEDLMPFNDEQLAREIYRCPIPTISGVGHETDFTICDFVADVRAATPTAAAQASCPDQSNIQQHLINKMEIMRRMLKQMLLNHRQTFKWVIKQLLSPTSLLFNQRWQTIDYLQLQLTRAQQRLIKEKQNIINLQLHRVYNLHPKRVIHTFQQQFSFMHHQLLQSMRKTLQIKGQFLENSMTKLHALSPLATLNRGYSIATYQGNIITDPYQVNIGGMINVQVTHGKLACQVINREKTNDNS